MASNTHKLWMKYLMELEMSNKKKKKKEDVVLEIRHPDPDIPERVLCLKYGLKKVCASEKRERQMGVIRTPKKRALLIGLKHPNPEMKSIDVKVQMLRMKKYLMELRGFIEDNITLMIEEEEEEEEEGANCENIPAYYLWRLVLFRLISSSRPGDILFIHLIAHGCSHGNILDAVKTHIQDMYFRGVILRAIRAGCNLTFLSDCLIDPLDECPCPPISCQTEERLKTLCEYITSTAPTAIDSYRTSKPTNLSSVDILNPPKEDDEINKTTQDNNNNNDSSRAILLMPFARDSNLTARELNRRNNPRNVSELFFPPPAKAQHTLYGGFTNAILDVIEETHGHVTNLELAQKAMDKLGGQIPSLRCADHSHAYASFVC